MKTKTKYLLLAVTALVLVAAAVVVAMQLFGTESSQPETTLPEATEQAATQPGNGEMAVKLYWNVDQAQYEDPTTGVSTRRKDKDGLYSILVAVDGTQQRLSCSDAALVDRIDANRIVGLSVDQNEMITQVYTLDELGYSKTLWQFYVQSVDENGLVTAFSNETMTGEQQQATVPEDAQIYLATGADVLAGMKTDIREYDRIMGLTDSQGKLSHVYIISRVYTGAGEMRYCEHCKQEVKWWSWENPVYLPTIKGHFYLAGDVQMTKQSLVRENIEIVLDLNGNTVKGKLSNRIFATWGEGAYLGIMDTSPAKTGRIIANGSQMDQGCGFWIRYGTVEMFSGTLDVTEANTVKNGSGVLIKSGATFNMYGGEILGGISRAVVGDSGKATNGCGGNMYIEGTFNMYGGRIADGRAVGITTGNTASMGIGGNLYVTKTGVVNLEGGVVENGTSTGPGANIYTNGQINVKDGFKILGGTAEGPGKNGGSIYVTEFGTLNMNGGEISGGNAAQGSGGNLCTYGTVNIVGATIGEGFADKNAASVYGIGGTMHIADSTITHCIRVGSKVDFSLGGTMDIKKMELPTGALINVDALKQDSKIIITASGFFTEKSENNCAACFQADGYKGRTIYSGGRLTIGFYRCICAKTEHASWCDGKSHLWKAWNEEALLPTDGDYFYLTDSVRLNNQCTIREGQKVNLDLRGYNVYGKENLRVFATWGEGAYLGISDSSAVQTGRIVVSGKNMDMGGGFWIRFGTVEMFGGTLDATKAEVVKNGAAVLVKEGATFNLYNGTIKGGTSQAIRDSAGKPMNGSGGNLYIEGNFNMYGGQILDGKAVGLSDGTGYLMGIGGNLYASKTSVVNLMSGIMKDGISTGGGGNIYMAGQVTIGEDMQVIGGVAEAPGKSGGNINVNASGSLFINGGLVQGGSATNLGGVISNSGQVTVSGGTVSGGTAGNALSNNIVILKGATLTLSGGTVDGGIRQAVGGNLILKENPVVTGTGISSADGALLLIEGTLGETAKVVIPMEKMNCYFAQSEVPGNTGAFVAVEGYEVLFDEAKKQIYYRSLEAGSDHAHAGDPEDIQWTEWDGSAFVDGGHYYLPEGGLTLETRATVNGIRVTLCLNGQTLTGKPANRTFFVLNGGNLTICDCSEHQSGKVLAQGENKENGGNIMVGSKSTLNLEGGTICGGSVKSGMFGGNVNIVGNASGNGVLNMSGGRITGGKADENAGGNLYITGTLNMSGGQIDGLVVASKEGLSKINISGSAKILGEETSLYLPAGKLVNINGALDATAMIGITLEKGTGVFTMDTDAANVAFFKSDDGAYIPSHNGNALEMVAGSAGGEDDGGEDGPVTPPAPTGHDHCFCEQDDHTHLVIGWTAWDGDVTKLQAGGYYFLENDATLTETVVLGSADTTPKKPVELYLCLNGHTLTAPSGKQVFQIYADYTLNLCDCSEEETGKLQANGKFTGTGGVLSIAEDGTLNQYGGTITGGHATNNGGNIAVTAKGNYTLYNGKVTAGTSTNMGGNISVSAGAVFTMLGGEISGGTAKTAAVNSSNIVMAAAGTITLEAGYIQGGMRATSGTVNLSGTIQITDGKSTNLSVSKNSIIKIVGPLTGTKKIGIGGATVFATGVTEDVSAYFFADTAGKTVTYDAATKELKLV